MTEWCGIKHRTKSSDVLKIKLARVYVRARVYEKREREREIEEFYGHKINKEYNSTVDCNRRHWKRTSTCGYFNLQLLRP